ncbi:MAG TPA: response regulator [Anaeromyxobacteraceae bacterium]|nr:response regulator [Anaeromyxobacteraceae bacterium]
MNRRYLIVDDNRAFADNLAEIVRELGDQVTVAETGAQALQLAGRKRFDAMVTDMRMPVMGGAQLVKEVRRVDPGISAIVVTAHVADREIELARQEGLLAVLSKPVPIHGLLDLLGAARRDALAVIVEDDLAFSEGLCEALRARGFAALTASSVLETEELGPVRPFVALVDLLVPGGPAGEAMRRLAGKYPGIPQLVITGLPDDPPVPCQAVFRKPFRTEELLAAVERCHAARAPDRPPAPRA